jgi:hypothetical protein
MRNRTRVLLALWLAPIVTVTSRLTAIAAGPVSWEVTLAVRMIPSGNELVSARIALPPSNARQRLTSVDVSPRGLEVTEKRQGEHPYILLRGKLTQPRRVAVTFRVETEAETETIPPIGPPTKVDPDLIRYVAPAPLFQSRSLLVREFLETQVAPTLPHGATDIMQPILAATRREIQHRRDGKSLALDVIRRRQGKRIGIERVFTTFLRCAGMPARLVEGINLKSTTNRKQVFWTEVWSQGRWWPVSASEGWLGRLPSRYLAVAGEGNRVVGVQGPVKATYRAQTVRIPRDQ